MSAQNSVFFKRLPLSRRRLIHYHRAAAGNILLLITASVVSIAVLAFPLLVQVARYSQVSRQERIAIEAASLAAAEDLGKIIVNDPHFGYISLSDYPPCGKATLADDGEPLPVLGINTLIGTSRLELLIAKQLDNPDLLRLAKQDIEASHEAAKRLEDALRSSISPNNKTIFRDQDGNIVKPYEHALQLCLANVSGECSPNHPRLLDFHLSLGWLKSGAGTITPIPEPKVRADVPEKSQIKGRYRACVDIPVGDESFYFAGVGQQPTLVDGQQFMPPDGKRLCSILKAEIGMDIPTPINGKMLGIASNQTQVRAAACAQAGAMPDASTPGVLIVSFPDGFVPGIQSIQDIFLNAQLNSNQVAVQNAQDGDFPNDPNAHFVPDNDSQRTTSQLFAQGLFDWLRTAHCRPRLDSVLSAVSSRFKDASNCGSASQSYPNYLYEFDETGDVLVINQPQSPFLTQTVFENQLYALSFQAITTGNSAWTVSYRDEVNKLGTISGGKHAGQTLPGDPVNWCDLAIYGGDTILAKKKKKGIALGIKPCGSTESNDSILLNSAYFSKLNGQDLNNQPRKSYYAGGLAVEFRLCSPMQVNQNAG